MKVVSFFTGAGGMDLGFTLAGHEIIWANDFDEYAINTYNNNIGIYHKHLSVLGDITEILRNDVDINETLPECDIIIGGFPCQGFSIANVNRNMQDARNFLYLELLKAISVKQPPFFLLENVKGLENMKNGTILKMILNDLESAGTINSKLFPNNGPGYTVVYNVINAYNFGVPQNRERVIILGIRNDIHNEAILNHILPKNKKIDNRKRLYIRNTHSIESNFFDTTMPHEKVNFLYENWKKSSLDYEKNHFIGGNIIYRSTTLRDAISDLPYDFDDENSIYLNHSGSKCKVKISNRVGNRATFWDKYAPTVMGRGSGTGGPLIPPHPEQHRRLSVREVARIQTFPDNFVFYGSVSAAYRQIGNAVPVLMAYNIGKIFPIVYS